MTLAQRQRQLQESGDRQSSRRARPLTEAQHLSLCEEVCASFGPVIAAASGAPTSILRRWYVGAVHARSEAGRRLYTEAERPKSGGAKDSRSSAKSGAVVGVVPVVSGKRKRS